MRTHSFPKQSYLLKNPYLCEYIIGLTERRKGEFNMAKYNTTDQLIRANIPEEIRGDCLAMMEAVEQLGSPSFLAIIHTQEELDTITKQVQNVSPEVDEFIKNPLIFTFYNTSDFCLSACRGWSFPQVRLPKRGSDSFCGIRYVILSQDDPSASARIGDMFSLHASAC